MLKRVKSKFGSKGSVRMMFIYAVVLIAFFGINEAARAFNLTIVMNPSGKEIKIEYLYDNIGVDEIKSKIAHKTHIPVEQQRLYLSNGKELQNDLAIASYLGFLKETHYRVVLIVTDSYPPAPEPAVEPVYEEPVFYALPEDEIGAYALREDGTKEYLLFHTYDICMDWLASDELCAGFEHCFHKDWK